MMLHPDTQSRAQAELDKVTGGDHLPSFEDLEHRPYIRAVVTETIRWQAVVPLGELTISFDIVRLFELCL